ncbi:adenylate cyclase type 10-like isoform X2 [Agrilus planipennis]|uniref:Adenylate cyclase type 10-like isoform X2 n=1 Tax=Agrilus planipennis TaxID=224129 RepID=A0A1W4XAN8_AGRPL|nr:adenylate cyclase type 10-like isoform X2 [Agrilus planipennis]
MRSVRWTSISGPNLVREDELMRMVEISQLKKQIEVISTFLPDEILKMTPLSMSKVHEFVGILLVADVSGFTPLTEKYTKIGKHGIYKLTATLNAFIGVLVEVIYFYGGDILKFSGDAFLALWKLGPEDNLYNVIHEVIVCALFIQQTLGSFETEVNVLLRVKLAIACGNLVFSVIGNDASKQYVVLGSAVKDVKAAEHASVSGDVIIAPSAWGHLPEDNYQIVYTDTGYVKVLRCIYRVKDRLRKQKYDEKEVTITKICEKHLNHRQHLYHEKKFDQTFIDSKVTQAFISTLPERKCTLEAPGKWSTANLLPFVIKLVQEQVQENQPVEYLTEMREITIQFINIIPVSYLNKSVISMVDAAFKIVSGIISELLGIVNKISLFDKDAMILVLFGLKGIKHEQESQDALRSGFRILQEISKLENVKSVSVGITNGSVYCGVVGHPFRREYTVIGATVNKAARIMCTYPGKVTCDLNTYQTSKLSSFYFKLQSPQKLKGREDDLAAVHMVINHPEEIFGYFGICFQGTPKIGKSAFLEQAYLEAKKDGHCATFLRLTANKLRPYFTSSMLYKQIYDEKTRIGSKEVDLVQNLPRDLWNMNEILQAKLDSHLPYDRNRKATISKLFLQILKRNPSNVTVLFIDEIQNIDIKSLEIIEDALTDGCARLICTASFEENDWDFRWRFSRNDKIRITELEPLESKYVPALACQMLRVTGVKMKLIKLLIKTCENKPGWIQTCLLRLVNNGGIVLRILRATDLDFYQFIFPNSDLTYIKSDEDANEMKDHHVTSFAVADLMETFNEDSTDLTLAAISLDLFDYFSPFEQLVIKTASVLGVTFTRSLLIIMLRYPNERLFEHAIKKLFEEEVFDCGTKYITSQGSYIKSRICLCYFEETEMQDENLGKNRKYIFCKNLHFKNKMLRNVAYELLPNNQRKELHLRVTDILENQNNSCPSCLRDDSSTVIYFRKFKEVMYHCSQPNALYRPKGRYSSWARNYRPNDIEDIIRYAIRKKIISLDDGKSLSDVEELEVPKRKKWDPTVCFCLEILSRVFYDLIHHSDRAGHLGKRIFFLIQYGLLLITLQEPKDSISPLEEACELCMVDASSVNSLITESFRKIFAGKTQVLLASAYLMLDDHITAKSHILIALRQYDVPMSALTSRFLNCLLQRTFLPAPLPNRVQYMTRSQHMQRVDLGYCLNVLSVIMFKEGKLDKASKIALRSIHILRNANTNLAIICDVFANALDLYNHFGDKHTCEQLERYICKEILSNYSAGSVIVEDIALCRLVSIFFRMYYTRGELIKGIRLGFRSAFLNTITQAYLLQEQIIPSLSSALLKNFRITEAVGISQMFLQDSVKFNDSGAIHYYSFCVELIVEAGFVCESIEKCEQFADSYFGSIQGRIVFTASELKFINYLHLYFVRKENWSKALKWRYLIRFDEKSHVTDSIITSMFLYLQVLLINLAKNVQKKKRHIELEFQNVDVHFRECTNVIKHWKLYEPRYCILKAYYLLIRNRCRVTAAVEFYIKKAIKMTEKNGNILDNSWAKQNLYAWKGGFTYDYTEFIHFSKARNYSTSEWSLLMYSFSVR